MGKVDITLNDCLKDRSRYADCFNTALNYKLLQPEYLSDMERVLEGTIPYPKLAACYKKERDNICGYVGSTGAICAVVCIENQRDIDYSQVIRQFIYDAYSYNQQLTDIRKSHSDEEKAKGTKERKRYRGFYPEDRLLPVLTVCIYYGEEPWDAPVEIQELMDFSTFSEEEKRIWSEYIQNYKITVLDIRRMAEEQIDTMDSDLKLLFGVLKNSSNKNNLLSFIGKHQQELSEIQDDLYQAMITLTNTKELRKLCNQKEDEGGTNNMCKAIDDLMKDCREEGECKTLVNCIIEIGLKKFGKIPDPLLKRIQSEANVETLSQWFSCAVNADSIETFEAMI